MTAVWVGALVALWIVVLVIGFLLVGVLREIGLLRLRLGSDAGALITKEGLERGVEAPDFEAIDVWSGETVTLSELDAVQRVVVFLSPTCVTCYQLADHLNDLAASRPEFDYLVVCKAEARAALELAEATQLEARMLVDEHGAAEQSYRVPWTPFAYLLDERGRVLIRGVVNDGSQLDAMLDQKGTLEPESTVRTTPHPQGALTGDDRERSVLR